MIKIKPYKCPWDDVSCPHVDSLMMTFDKECKDCEHYDKSRIRPTGKLGFLDSITNFFKRK